MQNLTYKNIASALFPGRFLLVDDDKVHLKMLERYLAGMGFDFNSAPDGPKAVELLKSEHFDVVISDIQMPQMDGIELLRIIRKEHVGTDVILMTGYSQSYTFTDVIQEGATDYLEKPFSRDALQAKILRILKERTLLAEYNQEVVQRRQIEKNLQRKSDDLEKRNRELHCLYQVTRIVEQQKDCLDAMFQETINAIPLALQFPEIAVARLCYNTRTFCTADFPKTPWSMTSTITSKGFEVGTIDVYYTREMHGDDGNYFQYEDHALINEIAERIGRAIDRQRADEELRGYFSKLEETVQLRTHELHATQAALESVFQSIPDCILSVNEDMVITHSNEKCSKILAGVVGEVFPAGKSKFQEECRSVLQNTLATQEAVRDYRIEIRQGAQIRQVVQVSTSLSTDELNRSSGALLIIHDITRLADLENQLQERRRFRQMVGNCAQLQELYNKVRKLASVDTTVLITGESGTGKELLVEALHASGDRAGKPLVKVNCAALPENLLESELFGHIRGAFTGAVQDRAGRIEAAEGGILFLDEIGDISPLIQLKLLRFLEAREYERVGESKTRRADVRVFAATNADLAQKVQAGLFREDLYYRLKVMSLHLPPLRERKCDIPLLLNHFLTFFNKKFKKSIAGVDQEVLELLTRHDWPGNIREFKHAVEHAALLATGHEIKAGHLPKDLLATGPQQLGQDRQPARALTRETLLNALRQTDGNKAKTARMLKMSRATLYNKIKEFNLLQESGS